METVWYASMGPRFFKRGECVNPNSFVIALKRFNGATLLQAWRVDCLSHGWPGLTFSFNGATLLQAWRAERSASPMADNLKLQWGHASSSVESAMTVDERVALIAASMGPRFFKRGELFLLPPTCRL